MFDSPCWEYLALLLSSQIADRDGLVERGCLALIFAMASYEAGNVGVAFVGEDRALCRDAVMAYAPTDPELARLKAIALAALALAATPNDRRDFAASVMPARSSSSLALTGDDRRALADGEAPARHELNPARSLPRRG